VLQFKPGEILLNKYEISDLIGEGAFGGVYKARDIKLDRIVAVKFIRSSPGSTENFAAEIEAVKRLEHPNIARLYDYDLIRGGIPCLVMEYVDGRELGDVLTTDGPFNYERLGDVGCQVLDALVETHSRGIIHCDLKPENIMLTSRGAKTDVAKLIDFGVASLLSQMDNTKEKALVGTPQYMAPEQIRREKLGPYTDIYAIGLILIELWTGAIVFDDPDPRVVLNKQLRDPVVLPQDLTQTALGPVIERAVKKIPGERYQDTLEFFNDLKNAIDKMKSESQWQHMNKSAAKPRVARERAYPSIFQDVSDPNSYDKFLNLDVSYNGRSASKRSSVPLLGGLSSSDSRCVDNADASDPFDLFEGGSKFDSYENIKEVKSVPKASSVPQLTLPPAPVERKSNPEIASQPRHESLNLGSLNESLSKLEKMDVLEKKSSPASKSASGEKPAVQPRESEVSFNNSLSSQGSIRTSLKETQLRAKNSTSASVSSIQKKTNSQPSLPPPKSHGGVVVFVIILLLLAGGGYFAYSSGMFSSQTVKSTTSNATETETKIDTSIPGVRRATILAVAKTMADVAYVSSVKSIAFDPKKITDYDIIGTPVTAAIYVQGHLVCTTTPCTIHTYGNANKIDVEIKGEATSRGPGKSRKMLLSDHKNPKTPIMLSVP